MIKHVRLGKAFHLMHRRSNKWCELIINKPANGSNGGEAGRVVVEVDVGEHEGEAEVREVVPGVESFQVFVLE